MNDSVDRGRVGDSTDDEKRPRAGDRQHREQIRTRARTYDLGGGDLETMAEIGRFRTIALTDLQQFHFGGDRSRMSYDLRRLSEQHLVRISTVRSPKGQKLTVVALTRDGKRFLEQRRKHSGQDNQPAQHIYADMKKPAEVAHDASIYRMYQAEAGKILSSGGKIRRIVLDYELKKKVFAPLARARELPPDEFRKRQQEVASDHGLTVVDGKIPLPDLRIEYETREGETAKVDLELATEHYKRTQLAAKARAGFRLYTTGGSASQAGAVWEDRELTAGIIPL